MRLEVGLRRATVGLATAGDPAARQFAADIRHSVIGVIAERAYRHLWKSVLENSPPLPDIARQRVVGDATCQAD